MTTSSSLIARGRTSAVPSDPHPLRDPARLASIRRHRLLETPRDRIFDGATRLATRLLGTPVAVVSIVTGATQHLIGADGLTGQAAATRRIPAAYALCQRVVGHDGILAVVDAREDPTIEATAREAVLNGDLGVVAYLGVPLHDADGQVLGALSAIDHRPRRWEAADRAALEELATFVRSELLLRDHLTQVERSMQARDDLIRTEAHDLRAAVTAILGSVQTLDAHPGLTDQQRTRLLEVALRQGDRVKAMMEALLDPTRSAGYELAEVDLVGVIESAVTAASVALGGRERISLDLAPMTISTHLPSLERTLINLIRNGLQHTSGEVRVTSTQDRGAAVITVADEGPGLPDWLLVGDLGDASLRGRADGHGIGLFSAVTLVRNLGGELTVDTGPTGTTLVVALPDRPSTDGATSAT